jgi:hypothetical protein
MGGILFSFLLIAFSVTAKKKTNFVFFLVDDMGMMDIELMVPLSTKPQISISWQRRE